MQSQQHFNASMADTDMLDAAMGDGTMNNMTLPEKLVRLNELCGEERNTSAEGREEAAHDVLNASTSRLVLEGAESLLPACIIQGVHGKGKRSAETSWYWEHCGHKPECDRATLLPEHCPYIELLSPTEELKQWTTTPEDQLVPVEQPRDLTYLQQDRFTDDCLREALNYAADHITHLHTRIKSLAMYGNRPPLMLCLSDVPRCATLKLACIKPAVVEDLARVMLQKALLRAAKEIELLKAEAEGLHDAVLEARISRARAGDDGEVVELLRLGLAEVHDQTIVPVLATI